MPDIEKEEALDNSLLPTPSEKSPLAKLVEDGNEITNKIIVENDPTAIDNLEQLFILNQKKKNISRANRLSNLLEIIDDEVILRFTTTPEAFDNEDLLKYMNSTQQAINSVSQQINQTPQIQINNQSNEIHINNSGLNQESRERVVEAVSKILRGLNQSEDNIIDVEIGDGNG